MTVRRLTLVVLLALGACSSDTAVPAGTPVASSAAAPVPKAPAGPTGVEVAEVLRNVVPSLQSTGLDPKIASVIGASGDVRNAWILSDLLRFADSDTFKPLVDAFERLARVALGGGSNPWQEVTDLLISWDTPAPPDYLVFKRDLFTSLEPRWKPIFDDPNADIDWRFLSWGGVLPDDRLLGDKKTCVLGCIPALDDPLLTSAGEGTWYPDEAYVFGISIGGESVAFPKNIMEVHEMVNISIGGRRVAIPYCTLCGSAQAYFTDQVSGVARPLVMRTSGLLALSNKVMYDLDTGSVFDTFTGRALSGPLHDAGVGLPMLTTVVSRWDEWRSDHPNTRIVAQDGGLGKQYPADPLRGRDDKGPIFPIRRSDTRLAVHTQVVGVIAADTSPVAFPVDAAQAELRAGRSVSSAGVTLTLDGGGLVASIDGKAAAAHQSFWFAWAQFHPGTKLWSP